jgi:hypothetical protein
MERKNKLLKKASIYLGGAFLIWSAAFYLNIIPFPLLNPTSGNYGRPCYSPNQEYYIERYTTLSKALFVNPSYSKAGIAILYDKTGKELYRGLAEDIYKPGWNGNHVGFFGRWGGRYSVELPSSSGEFLGCF